MKRQFDVASTIYGSHAVRTLRFHLAAAALTFAGSLHAQPKLDLTGTVIVTNKGPSTATVIDVASGRTLATLPTGNGPHEIVISSDGRLAVVSFHSTEDRIVKNFFRDHSREWLDKPEWPAPQADNPQTAFNVLAPGAATPLFNGARTGRSLGQVLTASGTHAIEVYLSRAAARRSEAASYTLSVSVNGTATKAEMDMGNGRVRTGTAVKG